MDICDSIIFNLSSFPSIFVGFSMVGIIEALSVVTIVFYVCTRTRASSLLGGLVRLDDNYAPFLLFSKGSQLLASFYYKNEDVKPDPVVDHGVQDLLTVTKYAGRKPYSSFLDWGIYFPFLAQCVRLKKFAYPQVAGTVMRDIRLQRAVRQAAEEILRENKNFIKSAGDSSDFEETELYQKILKQQEKRAARIVNDMRSKISDILLRITSWILYKLLPCFLSGVVTHTRQIEMLRNAAEKAPGVPLIFLPLHRSHLDYIMVSFILLNNDIRSPIVAAGNNLQIPVFGSLLRGLGAFFIKRKIDPIVGKKDTLYRAILHLYLQQSLEAGHNVEFFIEGGRTRTGKPCMPKNGILSVIVKAFMDGTISDALLVPVSVNYERLVDGNFVREQVGQKKEPETFRSAISGIWKVLNSKYGLMRIDFNEPFSIRELVQSYNKIAQEEGSRTFYKPAERQLQHNPSSTSLYGTDVVCEEHRTLVDSISRQVVYDCAEATSVMTTNAVAYLLLTRFREGVLESTLALELDNLRQNLKGRRDIGFTGCSVDIVRYACELLGPELVLRTEENSTVLIKPIIKVPSVIELAYYSNALAPHFALESIVLTSMYYLLRNKSKNLPVSRSTLKEACMEHCEILRYEFILNKPTQNLDNLLENAIDDLSSKDLLKFTEFENNDNVAEGRKLAHFIEELDDDEENYFDGINTAEVFLTSDGEDERLALINTLAPFGYTYYYVAQCLGSLLGNSILESEFVKLVIKNVTQEVENGTCPFAESISTESIKNCIKLLEKWTVVEICSQHGVRLISLASLHDSSQDIQKIIDKIKAIVPLLSD